MLPGSVCQAVVVAEDEGGVVRIASPMAVCKGKTKLNSMSGLSCLRLQEWVARIPGQDLSDDQRGQLRESTILVCCIEEVQVAVQGGEANLLAPVPRLVVHLQPEQAADGILKCAEITSMHDIDYQEVELEPWTPEQV
jgi:hypothetical protein